MNKYKKWWGDLHFFLMNLLQCVVVAWIVIALIFVGCFGSYLVYFQVKNFVITQKYQLCEKGNTHE